MISPIHLWIEKNTGLNNLTPELLNIWQKKKLKTVIEYVKNNTKFYHKKMNETEELTKLPFTYPSEIAENPFDFLAIPQNEVVRVTTLANSGTTQLNKRIFFSKNDLERTKDFFTIGMSSIVLHCKTARICISNKTENSLGSLLYESLLKLGIKAEISGSIKSVEAAVEITKNTDCLIGMPVEMLYLSCVAPFLRPKSVLLAADIAPLSIIKRIQETWQCNVFNHYGHTELGFGFAVDCECHDGLHLRDVDMITEIIDTKTNQPAHMGEPGEITITTLSNEAMPLVRYRTGNLSRMLHTPCACGSSLFRLGNIEGRIQDIIRLEDGSISIHQLNDFLFSIPEIKNFETNLIKESHCLELIIDSEKKIDSDYLTTIIPKSLKLKIIYNIADPFRNRRKRRIKIIES